MVDQACLRVARALRTPTGLFCALSLTFALTLAASGDGTLPGDTAVARTVQSLDGALASDLAFTLTETYALPGLAIITGLIALTLGILGRYAAMFLVLATGLAQVTNAALKALADSPRPPAGLVEVSERANGLGFPSGHTMSVVVLAGVVIYLSRLIVQRRLRLGVQLLAGLQVVGIAFSRIYTGAHWPSDVLGGLLWGAWFVVALIILHRWLAPKLGGNLSEATA